MKKQGYQKEVRPHYLGKVILALFLTVLVFASMFLLGYTVSYYKYRSVIESEEQLRYSLLSFEVERSLLNNSCSGFDPYRFSSDMEQNGKIIAILEERLGKRDAGVLEQKKTYSLLETRHFLYVKEHNDQCANKYPVILFFYSNAEEYKNQAESIGYMLTSLKSSYPELLVYSFDYDLGSSLIGLLKEKYKITSPNTLVINEKTSYDSFSNVDQIRKYLA